MFVANRLRQLHNPGNIAGWMIDRNVNITNICFSQCSFCNFCRKKGSEDAYITSIDEYKTKVDELFALGGDQLLLQGGMNPGLDLDFYLDLFRNLKKFTLLLNFMRLDLPRWFIFQRRNNYLILRFSRS